MQVEAVPAPRGAWMRKGKSVLSWVEPGRGDNSFPKGKGCPRRSSHPTLPGSAGRGRGGAWAEERGLRSEKPQPRPQRYAVTFLLGQVSALSFGG